jgi:hypothetical protein
MVAIASLASSIVSAVVETGYFYSWLDRYYFPNATRGRIKDGGVDSDTDGTSGVDELHIVARDLMPEEVQA